MLFACQHEKVGLPNTPAILLRPFGGTLKRALDIVVALAALILLVPLVLNVALLVLLRTDRPVVLRRRNRIDFGGRAIGCYRFRTCQFRSARRRSTQLGMLLKRSGIDELPQIANVLKGEMSCVGPWSLVAELLGQGYNASAYLSDRPGNTGTWKLVRNAPSADEVVALASAYLCNWSLQRDIVILLKTIPAVGVEDARREYPMTRLVLPIGRPICLVRDAVAAEP